MRDDRNRWTAPDSNPATLDLGGATLERLAPLRQSLISGPGVRAASALQLIGWPDIAPAQPYAIVLRRDRIVEVGGDPGTEGWDTGTNRAFSDISQAYAVFDLGGPRAFDILKRGTEITHDLASASVARKLFALDVWLYRHRTDDRYRIHVTHALSEALAGNLVAASEFSRA